MEMDLPMKARQLPLRQRREPLCTDLESVTLQLSLYVAAPIHLAFSAVQEWVRYFQLSTHQPNPTLYSVIAGVALVVGGYKACQLVKIGRNIAVGRSGAKAVGQYLERFRVDHHVFNDVPTGNGSIDHVLIGPKGVFSIETKTLTRPVHGACDIEYMGDALSANGVKIEITPVVKARAHAAWLKQFYGARRFKSPIKPVVAFPGWCVESFDDSADGVWVLEPRALERLLAKEPQRLSTEEVRAMALSLSAWIGMQADV